MSRTPVGVLLMAYGAAESLAELPAYLQDILGGRPVPPALLADLDQRYRRIGGRSPLIDITKKQAQTLGRRLGADFRVVVGMRHSAPTIRSAVDALAGVQKVVALPLTPYQSGMSTGAYFQKLEAAVRESGAGFEVLRAGAWHEQPVLREALADKTRRAVDSLGPDAAVILSAHSLPARIEAEGDPYPAQLRATAEAVARAAGLSEWRFAFQSKPGAAREAWLGPDVADALDELAAAGRKAVAISPIGFISDHLETLYDDDVFYREQAQRLGMRFARAEALNDDPRLIEALAKVVESTLAAA
ncbi:MAG TPA: ferrochelatase [Elusimicrobiota bacterium]|nr:ferrochelatase [Elusimicrobiota bacterium]